MDENRPETGEEAELPLPGQPNITTFTADGEEAPLPDDTAEEALSEAAPETEPEPERLPEAAETPAAPQKKQQTAGGKRGRVLKGIMAGILTVLLVFLAILVFVFRDELTGEGIRRAFGRETSVNPAREAFTYETGTEQVFARAGEGLAVASSSSAQLLNAKGQTVFKQAVSFDLPAVFACEELALFCDLAGTGCIVADAEGESRTPDTGGHEILTASMNENGWFTVVTEEPGYKGLVSVYDPACGKHYEWWSGTGYVLKAEVSPDNKTLAVLTVEQTGTMLRFFALNSETALSELCLAETLVYDLSYLDASTVRAVGDEGLYVVNRDGTIRSRYALDGRYLLDYDFGSTSFTALFVSDYRGGAGGTLLTLDSRCEVLGSQELERDVVSMSAAGRELLVMTGGGLTQYDSALVSRYSNETLMTARRAILRPSGDILLLYAYAAERFSF